MVYESITLEQTLRPFEIGDEVYRITRDYVTDISKITKIGVVESFDIEHMNVKYDDGSAGGYDYPSGKYDKSISVIHQSDATEEMLALWAFKNL